MIVLLLLCLWFGQSQQSPAESQSPANAQQQPAQSEPSAIPKQNAGQTNREGQQNHSESSEWSDPMVILTILLVVGVGITAGIYYGQLKKMRETVALLAGQGKTMEDQLAEMHDQAESLSQTLRQTKTQLEIEIAKANPRLRVSKIRIEDFKVGMSPTIIVTVTNDGLIDATRVELFIMVKMDVDTTHGWNSGTQIVTVPAGGSESYPIRAGSILEQQHIDGFNTTVPLQVIGHFKYWPVCPDNPITFCYKYFPWKTDRPPDVSQFIPCDFDTSLNTTLTIQGAQLKLTGGNVGFTITKVEPENADPEDESNGEDNGERENPN